MPILVDFSGLACASLFAFEHDLKSGNAEKITNLLRHVVLSSLLYNKRKFGREYGQMIICVDADGYWRKAVFKHYKANRKKMREKSSINWDIVFKVINGLAEDLAEHFPYLTIKVDDAEADDIIGVLTKYYQTNELVEVGLVEEPQKVLILSGDGDNFQLHEYPNVRQWSPARKKFIKPENGPRKALIEKICRGDDGDGVPNIMSADDIFVTEGKRQTSFMTARLEDFYKHGIDACKNDTERRNYHRNETLVSYEKIPSWLQERILTIYKDTNPKGNRRTIMNYLNEHRCRNLIENVEDF